MVASSSSSAEYTDKENAYVKIRTDSLITHDFNLLK